MELRDERAGDQEGVRDVHLRAFGDHGPVVADLVGSLRELITPADGLSLVAEHGGLIVGHAMFTRSLLDAPRRKPSLRIPDAAFQAVKLPGYQPWMTGTLVYAEPFWRHDCVGLRDPGWDGFD